MSHEDEHSTLAHTHTWRWAALVAASAAWAHACSARERHKQKQRCTNTPLHPGVYVPFSGPPPPLPFCVPPLLQHRPLVSPALLAPTPPWLGTWRIRPPKCRVADEQHTTVVDGLACQRLPSTVTDIVLEHVNPPCTQHFSDLFIRYLAVLFGVSHKHWQSTAHTNNNKIFKANS